MFVRSWLRAVVGAGGAGLVVPVGLVLAVVVAATIGGASLGGLGQLFAGPTVPGVRDGARGTAQVRDATRDEVPAVPTRSTRAARSSRAAAAATGGGSSSTGGGGGSTKSSGGGGSSSGGGGSSAGGASSSSGAGTSASATGSVAQPSTTTTSSQPTPTTPAETNPVRQLGAGVQGLVEPLAPPVGKTASDAVGTIVDLVAPKGT